MSHYAIPRPGAQKSLTHGLPDSSDPPTPSRNRGTPTSLAESSAVEYVLISDPAFVARMSTAASGDVESFELDDV